MGARRAADRPIEGVIFDWGGTLTLPIEVIYEIDTWSKVAKHLAPDDHEELILRLGAIEGELWEMSRTTQQSGHLQDLIAAVVKEFGLEVAEESLAEAAQHHLDILKPHIEHDPDALSVLTEIKRRGLKVGLLSNTLWPGSFHEELLETAGLTDVIDARLYTSEMKVTKPHAGAFREALDALDMAEPASGVFVGDRPFDDIHGAQQAGLRTVHRPNALVPEFEVGPDAVIDDLPALLGILDKWMS